MKSLMIVIGSIVSMAVTGACLLILIGMISDANPPIETEGTPPYVHETVPTSTAWAIVHRDQVISCMDARVDVSGALDPVGPPAPGNITWGSARRREGITCDELTGQDPIYACLSDAVDHWYYTDTGDSAMAECISGGGRWVDWSEEYHRRQDLQRLREIHDEALRRARR